MTNPFESWCIEKDLQDIATKGTDLALEIATFYNGLCATGMSEDDALDLTRHRILSLAHKEAMIEYWRKTNDKMP